MLLRLTSYIKNLPFIRFIFPFILGIIFQISFHLKFNFYLYSGIIIITLFLFLINAEKIIKIYKLRYLAGLSAYLIFFLGGGIITFIKSADNSILIDKNIVSKAIITKAPEETANSYRFVISIDKSVVQDTLKNSFEKILVYTPKDSLSEMLRYGDEILFTGKIQEIKKTGNPKEFNYKNYLYKKGITSQLFLKSGNYKITGHDKANTILAFALKIRENLSDIYKKNGIDGQEFAVLSALTLGDKSELDYEIKQSYAVSGAMHILAVSGLHVGIIYFIISWLLNFLNKFKISNIQIGKYIKVFLIICFLWFFAFLSGLSPSVERAAIMFSFLVIGKAFQRPVNIFNSLAASAFILLIWNPYNISEVGFQMSYLAVFSIILFEPVITGLINVKNKHLQYIWSLTSVSIAAQIGTAPISLYYFHIFPNWFFLTNIIVIPLATLVVYVAALLFVSSIIPLVAIYVGIVLKYLVLALNSFVKIIEHLPFSHTANIPFDITDVFVFTGIIVSFYLFVKMKYTKALHLGIIFIIILISNSIFLNINKVISKKISVFNANKQSAVSLISGKENIILTSDTTKNNNSLDFAVKNYLISIGKADYKKEIILKDTIKTGKYLNFEDTKIVIINNKSQVKFKPEKKLKVNYIILSKNIYISISDIERMYEPDLVIFDSSNKLLRIERWRDECEQENQKFWSVPEQGAFMADL